MARRRPRVLCAGHRPGERAISADPAAPRAGRRHQGTTPITSHALRVCAMQRPEQRTVCAPGAPDRRLVQERELPVPTIGRPLRPCVRACDPRSPDRGAPRQAPQSGGRGAAFQAPWATCRRRSGMRPVRRTTGKGARAAPCILAPEILGFIVRNPEASVAHKERRGSPSLRSRKQTSRTAGPSPSARSAVRRAWGRSDTAGHARQTDRRRRLTSRPFLHAHRRRQ